MKHALIQHIEAEQLKKSIPAFRTGDTVIVSVKVKEGDRERIQLFEGPVIARRRTTGFNASFTVRKISHGVGVERVFQMHSPLIDKIEVKRHGAMRKAKLYHLRKLEGRKARIKEEIGRKKVDVVEATNISSASEA